MTERGAAAVGVVFLGIMLSIAIAFIGAVMLEYSEYSYSVRATNEILAQKAAERLDLTVQREAGRTSIVVANVGSAPSLVVGVLGVDGGGLSAWTINPVGISVLENAEVSLAQIPSGFRLGVLTAFGNVFWE